MTLKDLFITYWSQTVLILAAIGFLITRILNLSAKKTEIKFNLYMSLKIDAVRSFSSAYSQLMLSLVMLKGVVDKGQTWADTGINKDFMDQYYILTETAIRCQLFLNDHEYAPCLSIIKILGNLTTVVANPGGITDPYFVQIIGEAEIEFKKFANLLKLDFGI